MTDDTKPRNEAAYNSGYGLVRSFAKLFGIDVPPPAPQPTSDEPLTPQQISARVQTAVAANLATLAPGVVRPDALAEAMFQAAFEVATLCKAPGGAARWAVRSLLVACGATPGNTTDAEGKLLDILAEEAIEMGGGPSDEDEARAARDWAKANAPVIEVANRAVSDALQRGTEAKAFDLLLCDPALHEAYMARHPVAGSQGGSKTGGKVIPFRPRPHLRLVKSPPPDTTPDADPPKDAS